MWPASDAAYQAPLVGAAGWPADGAGGGAPGCAQPHADRATAAPLPRDAPGEPMRSPWDEFEAAMARIDGGAAAPPPWQAEQESSARAQQAGGGAVARQPVPRRAFAFSELRCLEPDHPRDCGSCTAPPSREEESVYELCGDPGKKNGEKKLRALLCRTREWGDPQARAAVADAVAAEPDPSALATLADVMTARNTSAALRKSDLLHLTRCWGFKSDLWCRREGRKRTAGHLDAVQPPLQPRRAEVKAAARAAAAVAAEAQAAAAAAKAAAAAQRAAVASQRTLPPPLLPHIHPQAHASGFLPSVAAAIAAVAGCRPNYEAAAAQQWAAHHAAAAAHAQQQHQAAMQAQMRRPPPIHLPMGTSGSAAPQRMPVSPLGDFWKAPSHLWALSSADVAAKPAGAQPSWMQQQQQQQQQQHAFAPPSQHNSAASIGMFDEHLNIGTSASAAAAAAAATGLSPSAGSAGMGGLNDAAVMDAGHIMAYIRSFLAPLAADSAASYGGSDARNAALLFGAAHVTTECVAQVRAAAAAAAANAATWRCRAAAAAQQAAGCAPELAASVAWRCFLGTGFALDRWLSEIPEALHAEEAACPSRAWRAGEPQLTPAEAAWVDELRRGRYSALELANHLQSLVAQVKLASLGTCLRVAAAVAELLSQYASAVAAHLAQRGAWLQSMLQQQSQAAEEGGDDGVSALTQQAPVRARPIFVFAGATARNGGSGGGGAAAAAAAGAAPGGAAAEQVVPSASTFSLGIPPANADDTATFLKPLLPAAPAPAPAQ